MLSNIQTYLNSLEDSYAPTSPKDELQQWDNYGIYNLYCVDRPFNYDDKIYDTFPRQSGSGNYENSFQDFLAVQAYHVSPITLDFESIVTDYYAHPTRTEREGEYIESIVQIGFNVVMFASSEDFYNNIFTPDGVALLALAATFPPREIFYNPPSFTAGNSVRPVNCYRRIYREVGYPKPPDYRDLLRGYPVDNRVKSTEAIELISDIDTVIRVTYFRQNNYEPIPNLDSIDWVSLTISFTKDRPYWLNISDAVLGTVQLLTEAGSPASWAIDQVTAAVVPSSDYLWSEYLFININSLFTRWYADYNTAVSLVPILPPDPQGFGIPLFGTTKRFRREYLPNILRKIAANNDYWNNGTPGNNDINPLSTHPMFVIDNQRAFTWHIASQLDGSFGTLIMDSPRIVEIHAALDAAKFTDNSIEPDEPRVTNLGHLIAKTAELLGYHPNDNGKYIVADEKKKTRRIVKDEEKVDEAEYGGNYFASKGMLVKRVPNAFDVKGEVVSGGVAMVHNLPEFLAEMQDQLNIALNIQESGAIEIKDGDRAYRYAGQLQLLTDLALAVAAIHQLAHQGYISSLVTQQQSGEIIAGMGLPTVSRVTNIAIDNKLQQIPYWGIAPQHSLARKIETVAYNVGIITGQLI